MWSAWNTSMVLASGPFVLSQVFYPTERVAFTYGLISSSSYADLNDSACSTNITVTSKNASETFDNFNTWGEAYGFCDTANGSVQVPSEAKVIQAFSVLAVIFGLVSTVILCGCAGDKVVGPRTAGASALFGAVSTITVFSQVLAWDYYSDLRNGSGVVPIAVPTVAGDVVFTHGPIYGSVTLGPSFFSLVLASILFLYVAVTSFLTQRREQSAPTLEQQIGETHYSTTPGAAKPDRKSVV